MGMSLQQLCMDEYQLKPKIIAFHAQSIGLRGIQAFKKATGNIASA